MGQLWTVLVLTWRWRNLFLAWIGPVSQFRACWPNTDSLITPITTFYLACTLAQPCSLFNFSHTRHYPHCAPPTFIHPSFVLPARFIILYICPSSHLAFPSLFGQESPCGGFEWEGSVCVFLFHSMWVFRGRGGRCRKRQWLKDVSQVPVNPDRFSLPGSWQCQSP